MVEVVAPAPEALQVGGLVQEVFRRGPARPGSSIDRSRRDGSAVMIDASLPGPLTARPAGQPAALRQLALRQHLHRAPQHLLAVVSGQGQGQLRGEEAVLDATSACRARSSRARYFWRVARGRPRPRITPGPSRTSCPSWASG